MILGLFGFANHASATTYTWNPFFGGGSYGITLDASGNVYVVGTASSTYGSPIRGYYGSANDAFVAKFNSSGALVWDTFLGGSGIDNGYGIAVDTSGNIYVTGYTTGVGSTWGSPIRAQTSGTRDAFVAKLNSDGSLAWNTFLGDAGDDQGYGIAVDTSGNVYVDGYSTATWGNPLNPYTTSTNDTFIAKLSSNDGSLIWNTFLGGSGYDNCFGIAVDTSGNVYAVGYSSATWGSPMRTFTSAGNQDAYAVKLNTDGTIVWNTFLGGGGADYGQGIAVDSSNNVYVSGYSSATWGSPKNGFSSQNNAFAAKLNSDGSLAWNTFAGGVTNGFSNGVRNKVAVDTNGNVYFDGYTNVAWGSPVRQYYGSGNDAFVVKLSSVGALTWNTFLGGSGSDYHQSFLIAVDTSGNIYIDGYSDATWGTPPRAYISADAWVAKVTSAGALADVPSSHTVTASAGTNGTISPTGATTVDDGASQTFTLTPSSHYHVASISVDGSPVTVAGTYTFTNVTADHTISATFAIDTFTVTASTVNNNGSVTPAGTTTLDYGANQTYAITANTPYTTNVIVDGASQGPLTTYTFTNVTTNHTILADFSLVLGGGGGASASSGASSATSDSTTNSTIDSNSQAVETPTQTITSTPTPVSTPGVSRAEVITQIKQQLIVLIAQLIQILTLQAQSMGR
ncbi:MAG: SBBP repeat-containing protein [Candidatus Staskawiczbacteria bacterium]|nr:SBBP repeat-containing protein [Candidatus Staskawiczbacteria bacterium]